MDISLPKEPVYYYECSNGEFRITYFMPIEMLQEIVNQGLITHKVLDDYPDGVDLGCTEPDFEEFRRLYGYRPTMSPNSILQAFFALLTTTRNWKNFSGTGFISAKDMQNYIDTVEAHLESKNLSPEKIPELPPDSSLKQRRRRTQQVARMHSRVNNTLKQFPMKGIDKKLQLSQQQFSPIEMHEGEQTAEFFTKLLKNRRKS
jgi:hypothetical protein